MNDELGKLVAQEIRRIVNELEVEGFDDNVDEFKSWLLFETDALENGGNLIQILN